MPVEAQDVDLELLEAVLESIRPHLKKDGGDIQLVRVSESGIVYVRLVGACGTCPMSLFTVLMTVERAVLEHVPGTAAVVAA